MNVAQMLAHCSAWMEVAAVLNSPPGSLIGRIFGRFVKSATIGEEPIRRNMPTKKSLVMKDERQFAEEQQRVSSKHLHAEPKHAQSKHPRMRIP
jgi:hypothetical protein